MAGRFPGSSKRRVILNYTPPCVCGSGLEGKLGVSYQTVSRDVAKNDTKGDTRTGLPTATFLPLPVKSFATV